MAKKATLIDRLKAEGKPVLVVDGGDMLFQRYNFDPQVAGLFKRRAELIIELQKEIGIHAANVGDLELALGLEFVEQANSGGYPFVSANLRKADGRPTGIPAYRIIEIEGLEVGVFGLLWEKLAYRSQVLPAPDFTVLEHTEAARAVVEEMQNAGVDLIIALSNIGLDNNKQLAQNVPGINFIISGHDDRLLQLPERVGETLIFQALNRGMYMGIARVVVIPGDLSFIDAGERQAVQNRIAVLDAQGRVFMGSIAQLEMVQSKLAQLAQHSKIAKQRAKELLVSSSRVENTLLLLSNDIVERGDIAGRIRKYKAGEGQIR